MEEIQYYIYTFCKKLALKYRCKSVHKETPVRVYVLLSFLEHFMKRIISLQKFLCMYVILIWGVQWINLVFFKKKKRVQVIVDHKYGGFFILKITLAIFLHILRKKSRIFAKVNQPILNFTELASFQRIQTHRGETCIICRNKASQIPIHHLDLGGDKFIMGHDFAC